MILAIELLTQKLCKHIKSLHCTVVSQKISVETDMFLFFFFLQNKIFLNLESQTSHTFTN